MPSRRSRGESGDRAKRRQSPLTWLSIQFSFNMQRLSAALSVDLAPPMAGEQQQSCHGESNCVRHLLSGCSPAELPAGGPSKTPAQATGERFIGFASEAGAPEAALSESIQETKRGFQLTSQLPAESPSRTRRPGER